MNYSKIKVGYLISAGDNIGRVTKKKKNGCIFENGNNVYVLLKGQPFNLISADIEYLNEMDLQDFARVEAEKRGWLFLHLGKGRDGTSLHQKAGWPDCTILTDNGSIILLELKTKTKLSEDQILFKERAILLCHTYYTANTLDEIIDIYKDYE